MIEMTRLIFKLFVIPFALALTVVSALFSFILSASDMIFGIVSGLTSLAAAVMLVTGQTTGGIVFLAAAFLVSPFGLPALAGLLVKRLSGAGRRLRAFILR